MEKSHEAVHHPVELEKDIEEVFNGTTTFTSSALSELEITKDSDSSQMIKFKLKVTKLDGTVVVSPYLILSKKNTLRFVVRRACKDLDMKDCTLTIQGYDKLDWTVEQAGIQDNDVLTAEEVPTDTTVKGRIRSSISLSRRKLILTGLLLLLGLVLVATIALCVFFALDSQSKSDHPNGGVSQVDFSKFQDNNHTVLYHMEQDFWDVKNVFTISNSQDETDFYTVKASAIPARSNHLILLNPRGQQVLTLDEVLSADKETYEIRNDNGILVGRVTKKATTSGSLGDAFSLESLVDSNSTTYYDIRGSLGMFHYKFTTQQDTPLVAEMYKVYEASWTEQYDAYQVMIDTRHSVELILSACVVIDMIAHNNG